MKDTSPFHQTILFNLPKGTYFYYAPEGKANKKLGKIKFHKLDGMFSYCTNEKGEVINFSNRTPVIPID